MNWREGSKYFCPKCNAYWNETGIMHRHYNIMIEKEKQMSYSHKRILKLGGDYTGQMYCIHNIHRESYCIKCDAETKEKQMTREDALKRIEQVKYWTAEKQLQLYEDLGLLKFDEPKKEVDVIFEISDKYWNGFNKKLYSKYGAIRFEEWPEGLVLWVGGEIKWKSWSQYYEK